MEPWDNQGKFAILKNRMANLSSWVRSDMTNIQGWSDGLLTNVQDHQVFKFCGQPCADKSKEKWHNFLKLTILFCLTEPCILFYSYKNTQIHCSAVQSLLLEMIELSECVV